mgnify:CR=1 FL=1
MPAGKEMARSGQQQPTAAPAPLTELLLDVLEDVVGAANHARRGGAGLDEILAHRLAVEHGVEGGHLVHADFGHVQQLGHRVHGLERQPAAVLALCNV